MAKKQPVGPGASSDGKALSWREERFVEAYVRTGSRSGAYLAIAPGVKKESARQLALRMLDKPHIVAAVEAERERLRTVLRFNREDALRILLAIATTTPDHVLSAVRRPTDLESYTGLHDRRHALSLQKTPDGYTASTPTIAERRAALNDLWEKLGFGKESSGRDRLAFIRELLGAAGKPSAEGGSGE